MSRVGASLLLHGMVPTLHQQLERIEGVTRADVLQAAQVLARSPRVLAAVGPFDADDFDRDALGLGPAA
jgi:predicted Zn-dependent peptidase